MIELLLNLTWLLLALPAYWLWRGSKRTHAEHSRWQCLLALGCVLVILFPVISATDDLLVMRTEMEESPVSKRSIRQAGNDKSSIWNSRLQIPPALLGAPSSFALATEYGDLALTQPLSFPAAPAVPTVGRAPPVACLA